MAKEPNLPHNLPIAGGGGIDRFMPFSGALAQRETQTVLSKIWTRVFDNGYARFLNVESVLIYGLCILSVDCKN